METNEGAQEPQALFGAGGVGRGDSPQPIF
jgi:hypothetical protein